MICHNHPPCPAWCSSHRAGRFLCLICFVHSLPSSHAPCPFHSHVVGLFWGDFMKRVFSCLLLLLVLFNPVAYASNENTTVHITDTGVCYHRSGCGALRSDNEVTLRYAVENGYLSCDRCNPPKPDFDYVRKQTRSKHESSSGSPSVDPNDSSSASSSSSSHLDLEIIILTIICYVLPFLIVLLPLAPIFWRKIKFFISFRREKHHYSVLYRGRSPLEFISIPPGVALGPDDLPRNAGFVDDWGPDFTYYTADFLNLTFHRLRGCCGATTPIHAFYCTPRLFKPCPLCHTEYPDLSWFRKYKKIQVIKEKYKIK